MASIIAYEVFREITDIARSNAPPAARRPYAEKRVDLFKSDLANTGCSSGVTSSMKSNLMGGCEDVYPAWSPWSTPSIVLRDQCLRRDRRRHRDVRFPGGRQSSGANHRVSRAVGDCFAAALAPGRANRRRGPGAPYRHHGARTRARVRHDL